MILSMEPMLMVPEVRLSQIYTPRYLRSDIYAKIHIFVQISTYLLQGQPGAGGYREHDCLVIHHDGSVENVTKFPFGPEHNVVKCQKQ